MKGFVRKTPISMTLNDGTKVSGFRHQTVANPLIIIGSIVMGAGVYILVDGVYKAGVEDTGLTYMSLLESLPIEDKK